MTDINKGEKLARAVDNVRSGGRAFNRQLAAQISKELRAQAARIEQLEAALASAREDALLEAASLARDMDAKYMRKQYKLEHNRKRYDVEGVERCEDKTANVISDDINRAILALINKEPKP